MSEPKKHGLPPLSPGCKRCGTKLEDGWCPECADRRSPRVLLLLFGVLPVLGFGACVGGVLTAFERYYASWSGFVSLAGLFVMVVSPVAGFIYILVKSKWWKNRDGW